VHVLFGPFYRLTDGIGHTACLPDAHADLTIIVTYHDDDAKCEPSSTLHNFGNAGNIYNALI
jgi:hypothetical protein